MSPINSLWFKWKSLRLPWRRSFLVGQDLAGNTFWEFKDAANAGRYRRIVKPNPKLHYADLQVSPQWHQWLRYVREHAPTLEEQQNELLRQERIKHLARLADERWASKPSYLDRPQEQQPGPATQTHDATYRRAEHKTRHPEPGPAPAPAPAGVHSAVGTEAELEQLGHKKRDKVSLWDKTTGAPGESWQPEAWVPAAAKRR
ncbi:hypothetical protein VTO42DRAFT_7933 [Malbranchea cinnamomea]